MADATVSVEITAVDNATSKFQEVTTRLQKQLNVLVSLGNVASSVDGIFSSYQNLQIRLENSTLRAMEAQDQYNDVLLKFGAGSEEAQNASFRLKIAQNNLERANNQVIGTFIQMAVQSISLVIALIPLAIQMWGLVASAWAFVVPLLPTILLIGLITAAVYLLLKAFGILEPVINFLAKIFGFFTDALKNLWTWIKEKVGPGFDFMKEKLLGLVDPMKDIKLDTLATADAFTKLGNEADTAAGKIDRGFKQIGTKTGGIVTVDTKTGHIIRSSPGRLSKAFDDFIIRPGQEPMKINPDDTVIGFKGNNPIRGIDVGQIIVQGANRDPMMIAREIQERLATLGASVF